MQKRKLISALFVAMPVFAWAESSTPNTALPPAPAPVQPAAAPVQPAAAAQPATSEVPDAVAAESVSPMQEQLLKMMATDLTHESQKKKLMNELELETLRSNLRKLKQENQPAEALPLYDAAPQEEGEESRAAAPVLRPLLVSEIAGQTRVAISAGSSVVKMVPLNSAFDYGGYRYIAHYAGNNQIVVEDIKE